MSENWTLVGDTVASSYSSAKAISEKNDCNLILGGEKKAEMPMFGISFVKANSI